MSEQLSLPFDDDRRDNLVKLDRFISLGMTLAVSYPEQERAGVIYVMAEDYDPPLARILRAIAEQRVLPPARN